MGKYDDIIESEPVEIPGHPKMSVKQRAKIFLPFAALSGFNELLEQVQKNAEEKVAQKEDSVTRDDFE